MPKSTEHITEVYSNAAGYFWLCSCGKKFIYPDEIRAVNEHCGILPPKGKMSAEEFLKAWCKEHFVRLYTRENQADYEEVLKILTAYAAYMQQELRCTLTGHECGTDTVMLPNTCSDKANNYRCPYMQQEGETK